MSEIEVVKKKLEIALAALKAINSKEASAAVQKIEEINTGRVRHNDPDCTCPEPKYDGSFQDGVSYYCPKHGR